MTIKQEIVLAQYAGRMRTKRLRKKLLKYPERYFKIKDGIKGMSDLLKFEYGDEVRSLMNEKGEPTFLFPKELTGGFEGAYIPVPVIVRKPGCHGVIREL
jgi:hypothetical protein